MHKINWRVRFRNPYFWIRAGISILTPIFTYSGLSGKDLTTWSVFGEVMLQALANPYVLGMVFVSLLNTISDPTTKGFFDSKKALTYTKPMDEE